MRESFTGRLVALAEAHDLLNTARWEGANLKDVLSQAVHTQAPETSMRVTFDGPQVELEPKQALSFAMAIHELTTNAIKYGALSNDRGLVELTWRVYDSNARDWLELTWQELDGPDVVAPAKTGFGTRLIQRGLSAELDGEATLSFDQSGVRCVVRAPLFRGV